jgi:hypothetical protein
VTRRLHMICHSWDHLFFFEIFLPTMYKLELNHVFKWTPAKKKKSKTCPCTLGMGKKSTGGADAHVSMVLASWVPRRQWHRETCMRSNVWKFSDAPQVWLFYVPGSCYKGSGLVHFPILTQNFSSFTHHIKSFDACMEH